MKTIFCSLAFFIGCLMTVFISDRSPELAAETHRRPTNEAEVPLAVEAQEEAKAKGKMSVSVKEYGKTSADHKVTHFQLTNANGLTVGMIDYGATVTSVHTPDRDGKLANITLSCNDVAGYEACTSYFGSSVGRYCNRIAQGKFSIDGKDYSLATNNDPNHLHGGNVGFDKRMWTGMVLKQENAVGVRFMLISEDGDEGYPGKLTTTVDYMLTNQDELIVDFKAVTDKATHVNLTNHNYWNLAGAGSGKILEHQLKIEADQYLPVNETGIPTGELKDVAKTAFDFTSFHVIQERVAEVKADPMGYDHCFALRSQTGTMALAATIKDPSSGRVMEIHTTQPGIQFYTGNFLDGQPGSGGFNQHGAFCLETQHFPDAPNQEKFKSTRLDPGQTYHQRTIHKFRAEK